MVGDDEKKKKGGIDFFLFSTHYASSDEIYTCRTLPHNFGFCGETKTSKYTVSRERERERERERDDDKGRFSFILTRSLTLCLVNVILCEFFFSLSK